MSVKVLASYDGAQTAEKAEGVRRRIADALGVCCEDVILLPGVSALSVVEVPESMLKARERADAEAAEAAEAERAERERAEAESAAEALEAEKAAVERQARELAGKGAEPAWGFTPPGSPMPPAIPQPPPEQKVPPAAGTKVEGKVSTGEVGVEGYDAWTLAELHEEATKRDLHGRSGMDKASLAKALAKGDAESKGKGKK